MTALRACCSLVTVRDPLWWCFHRRQYAMTRTSFPHDEYFLMMVASMDVVTIQTAAFWSGRLSRGVAVQVGHWVSFLVSQSGPFCYWPREIRSAGSNVSICRHSAPFVRRWISATRFATNVWSVYGDRLIQCTMVLSIHKQILSMSTRKTRLTVAANVARSTAPHSSRRGIVCCFNGATLDFATSRLTCERPLLSMVRRYMLAPYAFSLALQNLWSWILVAALMTVFRLKTTLLKNGSSE